MCWQFVSPQVILVQVNPGEALTIRREDGQIHCITGKKSVISYIYISSRFECGLYKRCFDHKTLKKNKKTHGFIWNGALIKLCV